MVSQTEKEFVYKKLNINRVHFCIPDDALVVQNILSFLYTNSFSVCETT
jgi:hypothetical protein